MGHFLPVLRATAYRVTISRPFLLRMASELWTRLVPTETSTLHWADRLRKTNSGSLAQLVSSRSISRLPVHSTSRREGPTQIAIMELLDAGRGSTTNRLIAYCCV